MAQASFLNIPHFVTAKSPKELQRKMLVNNMNSSMQYEYFSIQFDGKQWFAWFIKEQSVNLEIKDGTLNVNIAGQTT